MSHKRDSLWVSLALGLRWVLFSTAAHAQTCPNITTFREDFDQVTASALPVGWTTTNAAGSAPLWATSDAGFPMPPADSLPNAAFIDDPSVVSDKRLDSPSISIFTTNADVTFRQNRNLETGFDGGVLEISIGGGAFTDVVAAGGSFLAGGYTHTISTNYGNPLAGRPAWSGASAGFVTTSLSLPASAAGQIIRLRWRMGSDTSVPANGWRIDSINITEPLCFGITAVEREDDDIRVSWMTDLGKTNVLERSPGGAQGNYSNNFAAIFIVTNTIHTSTNYLDVGAATNAPTLYYRVRLVL